jgi:hypothetical protein
MAAVISGSGCFLLGIVAGWVLASRLAAGTSLTRSIGFAVLGFVIGLALGMSHSPVLGTTITGGFALAGVLIPIYVKPRAPQPDGSGVSQSPNEAVPAGAAPSAPQPDGARVVESPPAGEWLLPLGGALAVGMLLGIILRVNDLLDFRSRSLRGNRLQPGGVCSKN